MTADEVAREVLRLHDAGPSWDLHYSRDEAVWDGGRKYLLWVDVGGGRSVPLCWVHPDSPEGVALAHVRGKAVAAVELARLTLGQSP
jgi:hypothetical protein